MLLAQAVELLRTDIQSLNWVDRYGGLTQKVTYEVLDKDNNTVLKTIPISCAVNQVDCNTLDQFYNQLVPDDKKSSILYFEPVQGFQDNGPINGNQYFRNYTARVRLVGWVNAKRLGLQDDCFLSSKLIRSLIPVVTKEFKNLTGIFEGGSIDFRGFREVTKDESIFNQYTYDSQSQYLLNPYDYFAIDIDISADLPLSCLYNLEVANSACWVGISDGLNGVPADYQGDLTGTFTGVQKLGSLACDISGGGDNVSFVVKGLDRDNNTTILGTFDGVIGDTLNTPSNWTTAFNIYDYIAPNLVGDSNVFSFAKLQFAQDFGFTNLASLEIFVEIRQGTSIGTPVNLDATLYITRQDLPGLLNYPFYLFKTSDNRLFISEFLTESSSVSGLVEANFNRFYTKRFSQFNSVLRYATYIYIDEQSLPFPTVYFVGNIVGGAAVRDIWELPIIGLDSNDNYIPGTPVLTNISFGNPTTPLLPFKGLDYRVNGKPVLLCSRNQGTALSVSFWDGVSAWVENRLGGGFLESLFRVQGDFRVFGNKVYFSYSSVNGRYGVAILEYTGDPIVETNWTVTVVNETLGISTPTSGTGATASMYLAFNCGLDTDNLQNGEPVLYVCNSAEPIIQRVRANTTNPSVPDDWDIDIVLGQIGVSGNDNLQGQLATFTTIRSLLYYDNYLYISQGAGGHNIRRSNANPNNPEYLLTENYIGTFGLSGLTESIEF